MGWETENPAFSTRRKCCEPSHAFVTVERVKSGDDVWTLKITEDGSRKRGKFTDDADRRVEKVEKRRDACSDRRKTGYLLVGQIAKPP